MACCCRESMSTRGSPFVTWSPDRTRIAVSDPLTWGCIMAEFRDLIVATYSLLCATGSMATVSVCTGRPCGPAPAAAAGFFWQPVAASTARVKQPIKKVRINLLCVTRFFLWPLNFNLHGPCAFSFKSCRRLRTHARRLRLSSTSPGDSRPFRAQKGCAKARRRRISPEERVMPGCRTASF